jgi:hypothetical protein
VTTEDLHVREQIEIASVDRPFSRESVTWMEGANAKDADAEPSLLTQQQQLMFLAGASVRQFTHYATRDLDSYG